MADVAVPEKAEAKRGLRLALILLLAFGFWVAHYQWWWKANDDAVHQYFNALKLSHLEVTRNLNAQALATMTEHSMPQRRIDRLELRIDVTFNWLLTSASIAMADYLLHATAPPTHDNGRFSEHLFLSETIGFGLAFTTVILVIALTFYFMFDDEYLSALLFSFAILAALAMVRQIVWSEFVAIVVFQAVAVFSFRQKLGRAGALALAAVLFAATAYLVYDHYALSKALDVDLKGINQPDGGLFQFVAYSLDTFIYPQRCCSSFGYFARSNFNLIMVLLFALRWSGRYGLSYGLIAAAGLIHVAQSGLALCLFLAIDLVLRPEILLKRSVIIGVAVAAVAFLTRLGAWPSFAGIEEHVELVAAGLVLLLLAIFVVWLVLRRGSSAPSLWPEPIVRLRARILARGPVLPDLAVGGAVWLALSLALFLLVKLLRNGALEEMGYLSQVTLYVTPKRLLAMLQAPALFGLALVILRTWRFTPKRFLPSPAALPLRTAAVVALVLWIHNLAWVAIAPFPKRQIEKMNSRYEMAVAKPPAPDSEFSEVSLYLLMALYTRTGHYVPNAFFRPIEK